MNVAVVLGARKLKCNPCKTVFSEYSHAITAQDVSNLQTTVNVHVSARIKLQKTENKKGKALSTESV